MLRTHFSTLCDSKLLSFVSLSCIDPLFSPHRWIGKLKKNPSLLWKIFASFWWHSGTHQLVGIAKYMYDITDWQQCKSYNVHSQNKTKVLLASCNSTLTGRVVHHTCKSHSAYLEQQQTYIVFRVSIQNDQRIVYKKQVNFFTSEKKITWTTEI